jgi:hypothetical protein
MPDESPDARPDVPPTAPSDAPPAGGSPASGPSAARQDDAPALPDEAELARVAEPATVRRAPKFRAFVTAGVLVGAVVGFVVALATGSVAGGAGGTGFISFLDDQGSARLLVALAGAMLGALVAGILAVVADRRSVRRR